MMKIKGGKCTRKSARTRIYIRVHLCLRGVAAILLGECFNTFGFYCTSENRNNFLSIEVYGQRLRLAFEQRFLKLPILRGHGAREHNNILNRVQKTFRPSRFRESLLTEK